MPLEIQITSKLPGLPAALRSALSRVVEETAAEIEAAAKERAPVDTGNLRASIGHEADGLKGLVSVAADYAAHVEYGTEHQSPQPFLSPSVQEAKKSFEDRIGARVREIAS